RDAARVKDHVAATLAAGARVVVFPEATTTDGSRVVPFHAAMLQAAVDAGVMVQPVAIRYHHDDGRRADAAAFIDDMTFVESLRRVRGAPGSPVEMAFGGRIPASHATRRELARGARRWIARTLGLPAPEASRRARRDAPPRRAA